MLRRSVLELSRRRGSYVRTATRPVGANQVPLSLCRQEFSTASRHKDPKKPASNSDTSTSGSKLSAVLIGSAIVGSVVVAAYSTGYLDGLIVKGPLGALKSARINGYREDSKKIPQSDKKERSQNVEHQISSSAGEGSPAMVSNAENPEISSELETHGAPVDQSKDAVETTLPAENEMESKFTGNDPSPSEELSIPFEDEDRKTVGDQIVDSKHLLNENANQESTVEKAAMGHDEMPESLPASQDTFPLNHETSVPEQFTSEGGSKRGVPNNVDEPSTKSSLLDEYHLGNEASEKTDASFTEEKLSEFMHSSSKEEVAHKSQHPASVSVIGDLADAYVSKDGKLIMDFLQAIHAAEQRQAELDARVFDEEKRTIKGKYDKELKDARATALMYAEEVAMLDKEIKKERAKAVAVLKALQEKAEERLNLELEQKEKEAESKLKEVEELAKAELVATIAQEKASQIAKMEEANLNINALCMAFYARTEEARQNHSIHKLALGALALEDALSNGLPIQRELEALRPYLEGVDKDSLLDLALSSLPEDTRAHAKLRHFSLLPPGGGGLLTHAVAHVASSLKVKEASQCSDGIESVISRVESLLTEGRVAEAADALENGVKGSAAAEIVGEWVRRARNRAITEQALSLVQSYATSISISLT
ncbi:MICOS complex subunit MIC60, mitochondrial-like protein [Drosera capensis]